MKFIPIFLVGLLLISAPALAELSVEDLGKIETMFEKYDARMREFVALEIAKSEKRTREFVTSEIEKSDKRMREHVTYENRGLSIRMDGLDKQQDRNFLLLLGLLAFIAVVIGLPLLWDRKNTRTRREDCGATTAN